MLTKSTLLGDIVALGASTAHLLHDSFFELLACDVTKIDCRDGRCFVLDPSLVRCLNVLLSWQRLLLYLALNKLYLSWIWLHVVQLSDFRSQHLNLFRGERHLELRELLP